MGNADLIHIADMVHKYTLHMYQTCPHAPNDLHTDMSHCCSRAQTLHTFLQPSQASPDVEQRLSTTPTQTAPQDFDGNAAVRAAAAGLLAGGPVRRKGAHRCSLHDTPVWRLQDLVIAWLES